MEYDVFGIRWIEFHLSFIYGKSLNATWMIKDTGEQRTLQNECLDLLFTIPCKYR